MRKPIAWTLAAVALVAVLVTAIIVGVKVLGSGSFAAPTPECSVPAPTTAPPRSTVVTGTGSAGADPTPVPVFLEAVKLQNASTINAVGMRRGLPERARIIAIATAFQESSLRNLTGGDRDSVGLFQQRPSQGWGTAAQIIDPVYAAGKFYDALLRVPGWQQMSLTKAAQSVQYSAFPDAYAKWEGQATTLAIALGGSEDPTLSCRSGAQAPTAASPARPVPPGAAAASRALSIALAAAEAEYGGLVVVSASADDALVTVTAPGVGKVQAGRALAAWAVAHATGFTVSAVTVGARAWTADAWKDATPALTAGQVRMTTG